MKDELGREGKEKGRKEGGKISKGGRDEMHLKGKEAERDTVSKGK